MAVSSQAAVAATIRVRPQTRSIFEPDEQWRFEMRQRERNMTEMVGEAQEARDTALGEAVDEETTSQTLKDFELSMRNIRGLVEEKFDQQLSVRRWVSDQRVILNWFDEAKQEQQRTLEQVKKEEGEKSPNPVSESADIRDQVARPPEPRTSHLAAAVQQDHPPSSSFAGGDVSAATGSKDESADDDALDIRLYPLPPQPPPPPPLVPPLFHAPTLRQPIHNFYRRRQSNDSLLCEDDDDDQYRATGEEDEEEQHSRRQPSRPHTNGPSRSSSSNLFIRDAPAEIQRPPPFASQPSKPYGGPIEPTRVYGPVPEWDGQCMSQTLATERQSSSSPRAISRVDRVYSTASPAFGQGTSPRRADTLPYIPPSASTRACAMEEARELKQVWVWQGIEVLGEKTESRRLEARRNEQEVSREKEEIRWMGEDVKQEKDRKRLIDEVAEEMEEAEKMRKEVRQLAEEKQRLKKELKQMAEQAVLKKAEARKTEEAARKEQRLQTINPRLLHSSPYSHQLHSLRLDADLRTTSTVKTSRALEVNWRSIFNLQRPALQPSIKHLGKELSKEQTTRIVHARKRVVCATQSVLGKVIEITHDVLTIGSDLLDYVPIPGLAPAAHVLLDIWDAFEQVQSNRFASLRLVERCTSILLAVHEEVIDAGHVVSEILKRPIKKVHESFADVLGLLQRQLDMPFLKRFVGRGQILQDIERCDVSLTEALWRLGFSVQIQTMRLLQTSQANGSNTFGAWKQRFASKSQVRSSLEKLCRQQNLEDREQDFAELRRLLRAAVETTSDVELVEILEIGRDEMPEAMRTLEHTLNNYNPPRSTEHPDSDDLDRKFMENGIEALRRLTSRQGAPISLPSWTISRFEINLDRRIGVGLFSNVYKGTWRDRVVAIKMLADATPQKLFVREADIWKSLSHPNIVQLIGASSTSSEPPWFFVSPYYKNGNLVKYLKDMPTLNDILALRMMYEISSGMAYLHKHGVLHGDLKAVNVLVDDGNRCVITDFGQSELKSEVYRVTRQPISRGTLRWQAPELMRGTTALTQQVDVYAFAITCIEVITKGSLPWNMQDDNDVRHAVLVRRERPSLSSSSFLVDKRLRGLLHACWHQDPSSRPPFSRISIGLANLRHLSTGLTISQSI